MKNKSGIPLGSLWAVLIITAFIYAYVGIGIYFIWQVPMPHTFIEFIKLLFSSFGYIFAGIVCFIPTLLIALYFVIRDRNLGDTLRNHWPIFALVAYLLIPNIPGPVDEALVSLIAVGFDFYKYKIRRGKSTKEYLTDATNHKKLIDHKQ